MRRLKPVQIMNDELRRQNMMLSLLWLKGSCYLVKLVLHALIWSHDVKLSHKSVLAS